MFVKVFHNSILSSNTYVIYNNFDNSVWIVDPGDSEQLLNFIYENVKKVKGILLTHSHIDHIYGVNDLCKKFPDLIIYASELANEGMHSAKFNGSYYMEMSYIIKHEKISFVNENSVIELFNDKTIAKVINTPGHNDDCISFSINNYLFTGDALIPSVKVHVKSKKANRLIAIQSINKILNIFSSDTIICPGHNEMERLSLIEIPDLNINYN